MSNLLIFLLFLAGFFLEVSFFGTIRIFDVVPNILLSLIFLTTIFRDRDNTLVFAIIFGFFLDLMSYGFFGFYMVSYLVLVVIFSYLIRTEGKVVSPFLVLGIIMGSSLLLSLIQLFYVYLFEGVFDTALIILYVKQLIIDGLFGAILFFALKRFFRFISELDAKSTQFLKS